MVFQRVATDKLELSNSAIQCGPCQGIQDTRILKQMLKLDQD